MKNKKKQISKKALIARIEKCKNPKLKIYDLKYKDPKPDGGTHDIGRVEIP